MNPERVPYHIIFVIVVMFLSYGEYRVSDVVDTLHATGYTYEEFKEQGIGDTADYTRMGIFCDYIEFRMQK